MAWGIKNYNAFIARAKKDFKLTHSEAQRVYRDWTGKYGGSAFANSLPRHPRVAQRLSNTAKRVGGRLGTKRQGGTGNTKKQHSPVVRRGTGGKSKRVSPGVRGGGRTKGAGGRTVSSLEKWEEYYDDLEDYDVEYEASADYTGE